MINYNQYILQLILLTLAFLFGCNTEENEPNFVLEPDNNDVSDSTSLDNGPIDWTQFNDTYYDLVSADLVNQWRHYNVHDPSVIYDGEFYYCYNTDVAFGIAIGNNPGEVRPGLQIRRSLNLVEWEYVGWVVGGNGYPSDGVRYIQNNGGQPAANLWAPFAMEVDGEYRVYYSLASNIGRLSCIGLMTSESPRGPFRERGIVVTSDPDGVQTNAIDPSIIIDDQGRHWMYYGSSWDGIYLMELNPETGLALRDGDRGSKVAHRGFTSNTINGNIEAPEIIYNEEFGKYYLFIAYDWLETKYNVRVGRSDNPNGPFFDVNGENVFDYTDNEPMILAPYRFNGHSGWQGVSHPAVFKDTTGNFFMAHQGRPGENPFFMVLHTRQIHWTEDGWPMVSSQRYAAEEETPVTAEELAGTWEQIEFGYRIVPGFAEEQTMPDFQDAELMTLDEGGTINGSQSDTWSYNAPWLTLMFADGTIVNAKTERGRDWENGGIEEAMTVLFTGFDQNHTTFWGKMLITNEN